MLPYFQSISGIIFLIVLARVSTYMQILKINSNNHQRVLWVCVSLFTTERNTEEEVSLSLKLGLAKLFESDAEEFNGFSDTKGHKEFN